MWTSTFTLMSTRTREGRTRRASTCVGSNSACTSKQCFSWFIQQIACFTAALRQLCVSTRHMPHTHVAYLQVMSLCLWSTRPHKEYFVASTSRQRQDRCLNSKRIDTFWVWRNNAHPRVRREYSLFFLPLAPIATTTASSTLCGFLLRYSSSSTRDSTAPTCFWARR